MEQAAREMSLEEIVQSLPQGHRAKHEYMVLKDRLADLETIRMLAKEREARGLCKRLGCDK
jgi:hypothetical protein